MSSTLVSPCVTCRSSSGPYPNGSPTVYRVSIADTSVTDTDKESGKRSWPTCSSRRCTLSNVMAGTKPGSRSTSWVEKRGCTAGPGTCSGTVVVFATPTNEIRSGYDGADGAGRCTTAPAESTRAMEKRRKEVTIRGGSTSVRALSTHLTSLVVSTGTIGRIRNVNGIAGIRGRVSMSLFVERSPSKPSPALSTTATSGSSYHVASSDVLIDRDPAEGVSGSPQPSARTSTMNLSAAEPPTKSTTWVVGAMRTVEDGPSSSVGPGSDSGIAGQSKTLQGRDTSTPGTEVVHGSTDEVATQPARRVCV
mmetsp:Transcript_12586/g.39761  ORF Transcript_12586/g.39761 Transcript_12586/m.39761 type:complete len:307 (-) Transcript_12586:1643-2563(-)